MKKLIIAAGLLGLIGCKDVRTEYSEPVRTEVSITQSYTPAKSVQEYGLYWDFMEGEMTTGWHTEHHPAEHWTTISSRQCTQRLNDSRVYDHFKWTKPKTLEYVDVYRNVYGQRPDSGEKEIILLESKKTGCEFKF